MLENNEEQILLWKNEIVDEIVSCYSSLYTKKKKKKKMIQFGLPLMGWIQRHSSKLWFGNPFEEIEV